MTSATVLHALFERVGAPRPGHPAVVVARPGVGKTPLVVHVAVDAMIAGKNVLHVSLGDGVEHVNVHYNEVLRGSKRLAADHTDTIELLRRRMVLSYLERDFDAAKLAHQARMLSAAAAFKPDMLVVDGLHARNYSTHATALAELSREFAAPLWLTVSTEDGEAPAGPTPSFVLRLDPDHGAMRLVHVLPAGDLPLPWVMDPATLALAVPGEVAAPARLRPAQTTLYSGGAQGAEAAFGEAAARRGLREVNFTFEGHHPARTDNQVALTARELDQGEVSLVYVSRKLNRVWRDDALVQRVLQILWHVISRADQVFVVGAIQPDNTVVGGTGWGVELARMWKKDVWVYDQPRRVWFQWDGAAWVQGTARITSSAIAGSGTKNLEPHAVEAIDGLFVGSFE
jgi:hypothetical protein